MFSMHYEEIEEEISELRVSKETVASVTSVLWDWQAATAFLWADKISREECITRSERLRAEIFNYQVFAIAPLYVTSVCSERCSYCNFRAENKGQSLQRLRLSDDELIREVDFLSCTEGIRVIELVYATDPMIKVDSISRHVEVAQRHLAKSGGGLVGLNAEAFDVSEYQQLRDAGLDFVVLWQETYNRERYSQVHLGDTKKTKFAYRLDAPERMIEAGMKFFGAGVLSGLADWRTDWAFLMAHEAYLKNSYGVSSSILGIPRLKSAEGASLRHAETSFTDSDFVFAVALHQLFSPTTLPFVNTRECLELCMTLARGGGCLFTFNCTTIPGGYTLGSKGYQFPTGSFSASEYGPILVNHSLIPVMNWNPVRPSAQP
jgi:2-iminoacetate synthase